MYKIYPAIYIYMYIFATTRKCRQRQYVYYIHKVFQHIFIDKHAIYMFLDLYTC